jgi:hypothetical protein
MTIEEEIGILCGFIIPEKMKEFEQKYIQVKFGRVSAPLELFEVAQRACEDISCKTWPQLKKQNRKRDNVEVRMLYSNFMREHGASYQSIGDTLDRHHSSIIYSVKTHKNLINNNIQYQKLYEQFTKAIARHRLTQGEGA